MNTQKNFYHLDCTLRDGGYYNNWNFDLNLINKYLQVMSEIQVDFIELGFRSLNTSEFRGACAYTTDKFLDSLRLPKKCKISVMINASEIIRQPNLKNNIKILKKLFKGKKKDKVKLIRIACNYFEIEKVMPLAKWLKSKDYLIAINLMQISDRSENDIKQLCSLSELNQIDILYFADSTGSLDRTQTLKIINYFKKYWKKDIGIHAHDNMDKAMDNTLTAIENGVKWVDSTVLGMGRGPGNVKTENLILEMEKRFKKKISYLNLLKLIKEKFEPLKKIYEWGSNPFYYMSGLYGIHPSFIQGMLVDKRFGFTEILSVIETLKTEGGKRFSKELLNIYRENYSGKAKGTYKPSKDMINKEILILGTGPSIEDHKIAIENFIENKKPYVIALNNQKKIKKELINVRAACHSLRLLTDHKSFKHLPQKLIIPLQRLPKMTIEKLKNVKKLDFGIEVKNNSFKFNNTSAIIPNSLAISYALAIANSGKAKKIYLAGFDGYDAEDPRRIEMDQTLSLYHSIKDKIEIISVTPTKYKIRSSSVYAL